MVNCRCGWEGYFDPGNLVVVPVDWMDHLYLSAIEENKND